MTADTLGGVWSYAMALAGALHPFGTEIALMTMGAPLSQDQQREVKRLKNVEVFETAFQLEWMDNPWRDVDAAGEQLLELESRIAPDVVHLNGYAHGALPFQSPVVVVAHSCVLSWWRAVHHASAPSQYQVYHQRVSEGLRSAQAVVAPTKSMLSALADHYNFPGNGRVIPNGSPARALSLGAREPFILAAGRLWDEAKNFALLDRVAPRLKWPIHVAGDSRHPNGGNRIFENLICHGHLPYDTVADFFLRAAIYVHPARYEPFGLSILEAALSGCALVLGDIPSLRELWDGAAQFVPPDEEQPLQNAITGLINSQSRLEEMGCRARQHALRYATTTMAGAYLALYRELIAAAKVKEALR